MEEKEKNGTSPRKKAVKRFAVIFTVILLLLTFFSNTIMNYSLPEVSTTTVSGASVQQKIRCQGDVQAAKDKEISVSGERVVKEVLVESGDHVKKGDVLVTFDEEENSELIKAQDALKEMERTQAKDALKTDKDYTDTLIGIENDKDKVQDAQDALAQARQDEADLNAAKRSYENLKASYDSKIAEVYKLEEQFNQYAELVDYQNTVTRINELDGQITELQTEIDSLKNSDNADDPNVQEQISVDETAIQGLNGQKSELELVIKDVQEKADALAEAKAETDAINAEITDTDAKITELEAKTSVKQAEDSLKEARQTLDKANRDYATSKKEDNIQAQKDAIDNEKAQEDLEKQRKEIEKLKEADDTACIVAPEDGIITNISLKEGDKVTSEAPIASLQLESSGYEVSCTVPKSDARLIKVGDEATIENVWGDDTYAEVKSIKADPEDPNKNMQVKFEVKGEDISIGQTLQFAVGEKSQRYDCVVPNNAVKEDNGGHYVLVVKVKQTPLGNRYVIKKVEVTVAASDTTKSAIQGDVTEYDNVVTNASKSVDNGQQVRLSDKQ